MIKKKDLLAEMERLLAMEEELRSLCARQSSNAAFFTGIPPKNRSDVRDGLKIFCGLSEMHRQTMENLIGAIRQGDRDAY